MTITIQGGVSFNSGVSFMPCSAYLATSPVSVSIPYNSVNYNIPLNVSASYTSANTIGTATYGTVVATGTSITYTPNIGFNGTDTFAYYVSRNGVDSNSSTVYITMGTTTTSITPTVLTNGKIYAAYTSTAIVTNGGTGPYTVSVSGGALPTGLSICSANISGTPDPATVNNTYTFALTSFDSSFPKAVTATNTYTIFIDTNLYSSVVFGSPGSYTWTAPPGVTSVSVVVVGGGGGGASNTSPTTPCINYSLATAGSQSWWGSTTIVRATGGGAGAASTGGSAGTHPAGTGGGNGGSGGTGNRGGGGGGAGGYAGNGGSGGATGGNGAGGGGGGGGNSYSGGHPCSGKTFYSGSGGGGVGLYGQGSNGAGSTGVYAGCTTNHYVSPGTGGSCGGNGNCGTYGYGYGGNYGAGGAGANVSSGSNNNPGGGGGGGLSYLNNYAVTPGNVYNLTVGAGGDYGRWQNYGIGAYSCAGPGAGGAVRIVWPGTTRQFPSTNVNTV